MANAPLAKVLSGELQVEVFGVDLSGRQFCEQTRTLTISGDSATISLANKLAPESEFIIRNPATNKETVARVIEMIQEGVYGVVFCNPSVNPWQIESPEVQFEKTIIVRDQQRPVPSVEEPAIRAQQERRRAKRTVMKTSACIRSLGREVVVECEDVSRGGFRFKSLKAYPTGMQIEAAMPYMKSSVNIFVTAQIAYQMEMSGGFYRHGVAYIAQYPDSKS
jgi:hypothetical protein